MNRADRVVRHFCHVWGIPLLAGPARPGDRSLESTTVLRTVLREADARLVLAGALWLSLLDPALLLPGEWSATDRRRTAYLCEVARCLGLLRDEPASRRPPDWPARTAGIEPAVWARSIVLLRSPAPPVASSRFGDRWGIVEVIPFSDYAAFQRKYGDRRRGKEVA